MYSKSFLVYLFVLFLVTAVFGSKDNKDSLILVLRTTDIPSEKIVILNKLAKAFVTDDAVRSENYASQALFISKSIENVRGKSEAYYNLGLLAYNKNQYDKSTDYLLKAEEGFNALNDEKWLAKVYLLLSDEYKRNLEYEKAINVLFDAMETFKKLGKLNKLAETYNAIGGNYYDQGNYEKAYEFYVNSLDVYKE
jgi:tetratricopeptide (TPR) repeat protein